MNINEVKPTIENKVDIDLKLDIRDIAEQLYELRRPLPPKQRQLIEQLYRLTRKLN